MRYLIVSIFFLVLVSCKKEVPENNFPTTSIVNPVYAGVSDSNFVVYDYQPNLEVSITWDVQLLYGVVNDSIDLDLNGIFDVYITMNVLNPDSAYLLGGAMPNPFPGFTISTSSEFQLAFYTESYPIGMGQTGSASFVDRLDVNERIDLLSDWRDGGTMWQENPGVIGAPPYGDWHSASNSNYIGIKQNGDKFGWIEMDGSDVNHPKFVRCAIRQ